MRLNGFCCAAYFGLWHKATDRCGANVLSLLGVKRTLRGRPRFVDVKRLTYSGHRPPFFVAMHATNPPFAAERPFERGTQEQINGSKKQGNFLPAIIELSEPVCPTRRLPYRHLSQ